MFLLKFTDGHEFEQAPGTGEGQGNLLCCSSWGRKESDMSQVQAKQILNARENPKAVGSQAGLTLPRKT